MMATRFVSLKEVVESLFASHASMHRRHLSDRGCKVNGITEAANTRWLRGDIEGETKDRYGRTVAELLTRRGNVNQLMVEAGQAFAYRRYLRQCDSQRYLQLENEAQRQGIGVWSIGPSGIARPWDYRRGRRSSSSSSGTSRKYRCTDIGSWSRAQELLAQGHRLPRW